MLDMGMGGNKGTRITDQAEQEKKGRKEEKNRQDLLTGFMLILSFFLWRHNWQEDGPTEKYSDRAGTGLQGIENTVDKGYGIRSGIAFGDLQGLVNRDLDGNLIIVQHLPGGNAQEISIHH